MFKTPVGQKVFMGSAPILEVGDEKCGVHFAVFNVVEINHLL